MMGYSNRARLLALDVLKNADDDVLFSAIANSDKQKLPIAELDAFQKYLSEEGEKIAMDREQMAAEDFLKSPKKDFVKQHKEEPPFFVATAGQSLKQRPQSVGRKIDDDSSELFAALFSGPGSLGVKSPKLPKQENEFPLGLKAFDTQLEPQENHSDEDAFT